MTNAGVGPFGQGVLLTGIKKAVEFQESRKDKSKANAENVERMLEYTMALTDYVIEIQDKTNENFILVTNEIAEVRRIEQLIAENQIKNWKIMETQFQTIERNFLILRDCTQTLYSNQQLNFSLDTIASLLNLD